MESTVAAATPPATWRQSRWLAALELAIVLGIFVADQYDMVPFSTTPFTFALGWMSLRLRGLRWRDVGFTRPQGWWRALAVGTVAGLAMESFALFVTEPLVTRLMGHHPDLHELRFMVGNLKATLVLILIGWPLAAFGEEMVYRGYLLNRLAGLGRGTGGAFVLALVVVSVLFGVAHSESQGVAGTLQEGWNGLLLGVIYLACGRRLAPAIVAHGMSNTLAFTLIYLGLYPGV